MITNFGLLDFGLVDTLELLGCLYGLGLNIKFFKVFFYPKPKNIFFCLNPKPNFFDPKPKNIFLGSKP
jgi:hypothetical protein